MLGNISLNRTQAQAHTNSVARPRMSDQPDNFQSDLLEGFIKHPKRFPLQVKKLKFWQISKIEIDPETNTGLTFSSKEYQKPGNIIEVTIPTRKEIHHFMGKVVMVKEFDDCFEIGIWLVNSEDVPKLRIVEQICHIELYLNDKRYKEGPFLSQERLTEEWICRFASGFPVN